MASCAKKTLLIGLGAFICFVLLVQCLTRALHKDFNGDEAFEVQYTLAAPYVDQMKSGAPGQVSSSPLYYLVERAWTQHVLKNEQTTLTGSDWRLSLRIVSATALALGCFITFLLWLNIAPLVAFSIPVLVTLSDQGIWFGAETRPYSSWIALSLILSAIAIRWALRPGSAVFRMTWILMSFLLPATIITSPGQIYLITAVLVAWGLGTGIRDKSFYWILGLGLALSTLVFRYYHTSNTAFGPGLHLPNRAMELQPQGQIWKPFVEHALLPIGGLEGLVYTLVAIVLLLAAGILWKSNPNRRLYFLIGAVSLAQLPVIVLIFFIQIWAAYYVSERHFIFGVAIHALAIAGFVALCADGLIAVGSRYVRACRDHPGALRSAVMVLAFILLAFDWTHWSVFKLNRNLSEIRLASNMPYCHGSVESPGDGRDFNVLNEAFHSNHCVSNGLKDPNKKYLDFNPAWIYGS